MALASLATVYMLHIWSFHMIVLLSRIMRLAIGILSKTLTLMC